MTQYTRSVRLALLGMACASVMALAGCGSLRDVDNKWCDPQPAQAATVEKKTD